MSIWRQKAISIAPELRKDFQKSDLSPYLVFSELLSLLEQALNNNDKDRVQKIYEYAEWCFSQKDKKLWNAAGVSFYEHLGDNEIVFSQFTQYVKKNIYVKVRDLLRLRLDKERVKQLDKYYGMIKGGGI